MTYVLVPIAIILLTLLYAERLRLDRSRRAIPLVIAVTGTRGKSTVTRVLAAAFRAGGRRVLSKTTGSEAVIVLPDGSVRDIRRRGNPSILEQTRVIHLGASLRVDVAVIEVMSIHRENHFVESHKIVRPDVVLVTNFRVDHTAAAGKARTDVASLIGLDIPSGARVFVPAQECLPEFRAAVARAGGTLTEVVSVVGEVPGDRCGPHRVEFTENLELVFAAGRRLGLDDAAIESGILGSGADIGSLRVWRYTPSGSRTGCVLVSAFAANDPDSTLRIHDRVMSAWRPGGERCIGLLSLRHDRGDRTLQWAEALTAGAIKRFSHLYLCGLHARALERRLRPCCEGTRLEVLRRTGPAEITKALVSAIAEPGGLVFGFGNIGGVGEALAVHWNEVAEPFEI